MTEEQSASADALGTGPERLPVSRSKRILIALGLLLGVALVATEAQAGVCGGQAPAVGAQLKGPVLQVIDGGHLCVAMDTSPSTWVEVQVLDPRLVRASTSDDARRRLMAAAFARDAVCVITGKTGDKVTAACMIEGEHLGARLNQPEIVKAAQIWR